MKTSLCGDGFDWQTFKNSVSTVAIIIPASKLQSHSGYTRLLITTALRELLSTGPSEGVPATALMLDETPTLGMLPQLIQACAICRGFGVRLMPSWSRI